MSTRLRLSFVLRSDSVYSVVLTVAITLASAAPIKVPAMPKNEATTAEDTAARALAATCTALSCARFGCSAELWERTVVSVRGEDMSSGGRVGRRGGSRVGTGPASSGYGLPTTPRQPEHTRLAPGLRRLTDVIRVMQAEVRSARPYRRHPWADLSTPGELWVNR
jgi:hypothetical protein